MQRQIVVLLLMAAAFLLTACGSRPIYSNDAFVWTEDGVRQGEWTGRALSEYSIESDYPADGLSRSWKPKNNLTAYGTYRGTSVLETALYNMAVDELINNIEPNNTLRTGALWSGVWTRDISYSILLSLAQMTPEVSSNSLMHKVDRLGRIVQDSGTGGSWPCSCDRVVWAAAAWEVYLATGDRAWIEQIYPIIGRSLEVDFLTTFNPATGLFRGESSFLDWTGRSYPRWMQPADIFQSECLGTNALYYIVLEKMGLMARMLGRDDQRQKYETRASDLKTAINDHLWLEPNGYYAQFRYGRNSQLTSSRSETLGEALCILSGIASKERAGRIASSMPVSAFGPTIFWPQIEGEFDYHNNAVWPFVTAFWTRAAAKAGNEAAVLHAFASNVRAAALFATNQENFNATEGDPQKMSINSPNMLWSLAGFIGTVHGTLLGMQFREDGIAFEPFVPEALAGERSLKGFRYRGMTLDITVRGSGSRIRRFLLDEKVVAPIVSAALTGAHRVVVELDGAHHPSSVNICPYASSSQTPVAVIVDGALRWEAVVGAVEYVVYRNGKQIGATSECRYRIDAEGEYQVAAQNAADIVSFASEPVPHGMMVLNYPVEPLRRTAEPVGIRISVPDDGDYALDWHYANGNGDVALQNKCAVRSLFVDGKQVGVSVFPQRGIEEWSLWGWSNSQRVSLSKGSHEIALRFLPQNVNMNIEVNDCCVDRLRVTRIR